MPVFNGEQFVAEAIDSILRQTFSELELVISDNASTDSTPEICRRFAKADPRVRYHRFAKNIGAMLNYARVYALCGGEYFKWAAHDDVIEPQFIELCARTLDENPDAVLAYPKSRFIDAQGRHLRDYPVKLQSDDARPSVRFGAIACAPHKLTSNHEIFGLMRRNAVEKIPQQGGYAGSDRVFLARLAMLGRFIEVPQVLFLSRDHPNQSIRTLPAHLRKKRSILSRVIGHGQLPAEWFDPRFIGKVTFPEWRIAWEYLTSARYGEVPLRERAAAVGQVLRRQVTHKNWARMARDFLMAADLMVAQMFEKLADPYARDRNGHAAHTSGANGTTVASMKSQDIVLSTARTGAPSAPASFVGSAINS
jgi:glycosyltransferase involved in cell wall biosynthesis